MKVHNIQSNNTVSFSAKYKLPVMSRDKIDFERHVAPLYESVTGEKIRGLVSFDDLYIFTGKKDIALLNNIESRTLGIVAHDSDYKKGTVSYLGYNFSHSDRDKLEKRISRKNIEIKPLKDMKELMKNLFA